MSARDASSTDKPSLSEELGWGGGGDWAMMPAVEENQQAKGTMSRKKTLIKVYLPIRMNGSKR